MCDSTAKNQSDKGQPMSLSPPEVVKDHLDDHSDDLPDDSPSFGSSDAGAGAGQNVGEGNHARENGNESSAPSCQEETVSEEEQGELLEVSIHWKEGRTNEEIARIEQVAQFKFAIISPVIYHLNSNQTDTGYLKTIAGRTYLGPDGKNYKFSLSTLTRMVREYRSVGINAFYPHKRADFGHTRVLSMTVQIRIEVLIQILPSATASSIHARLLKEKLILEGECSVDSIRRFIAINNLRARVLETTEERLRESFLERENGFLWAADTCYLTKIKNERGIYKWVYCVGIIDDHSRLVVAANCFTADTALNFQITLRSAIENYYLPVKLYVDNGSPYIEHNLVSICNRLGISLIHTRTRDGASKGVIERLWLSMESQIQLDLILDKADTLEKVQKEVDDWVTKYNSRVNRGVNSIPIDRHLASLRRHPVRKAKSSQWLSEMFEVTCRRRISNTGTIQEKTRFFRIPDVIRKQKPHPTSIDIYYDPLHFEETIHVVHNDRKLHLREDDREANARKKRPYGGRGAQLKEQAEAKRQEELSTAEVRAEERLRRRLAGSLLLNDMCQNMEDEEDAAIAYAEATAGLDDPGLVNDAATDLDSPYEEPNAELTEKPNEEANGKATEGEPSEVGWDSVYAETDWYTNSDSMNLYDSILNDDPDTFDDDSDSHSFNDTLGDFLLGPDYGDIL